MSRARRTRFTYRRTATARTSPVSHHIGDAAPSAEDTVSRSLWHARTKSAVQTTPVGSSEQFYVPEGAVNVLRCERCGGRAEYLVDYADLSSISDAVALKACFQARLGAFLARHARCARSPEQHQLDADVLALSNVLVEEAAHAIRAGGRAYEAAYLVTDDGVAVVGFPEASTALATHLADDERRVAVAQLHRQLREFIRTRSLTVRAVLHVGECWLSADRQAIARTVAAREAPNRQEALALTVLTPTCGRLFLAPLTQDDSLVDRPAHVGAGTWRILRQAAPPVDGTLAVAMRAMADDFPLSTYPDLPMRWLDARGGPASLIH